MRTQENSLTTYNKIIEALSKFSVNYKDKLYKKLKRVRVRKNLDKIRVLAKDFNMGLAEITKEVESVRKNRYESKKKKPGSN